MFHIEVFWVMIICSALYGVHNPEDLSLKQVMYSKFWYIVRNETLHVLAIYETSYMCSDM